jgi:hypothetical protein
MDDGFLIANPLRGDQLKIKSKNAAKEKKL